MNKLPQSLLLAGLWLATAPAAWAQAPANKTKPAAGAKASTSTTPKVDEAKVQAQAVSLTQNLKQALGLTPQQEVKVLEINQRCIRMVEVARVQYKTDLRKLNATVDDIGQSRLTLLKDVLSPAQFNKYQQAREKKMGIPSQAASQGNAVPGLPPGRGDE